MPFVETNSSCTADHGLLLKGLGKQLSASELVRKNSRRVQE